MLTKVFLKTKDEADVTFSFSRDDVNAVALVADFTNWQPIEMKFNKKIKQFKAKIRLPKNEQFHFRYLLDNAEWENDYEADNYLPNVYGSENSIVSTRPAD